jgi:hypothetical protein
VLLGRIDIVDRALVIDADAASPGLHAFSFIGTGGVVLQRTLGRSARMFLDKAPAGYLRAVVEATQGDGAQPRKARVQPIRLP